MGLFSRFDTHRVRKSARKKHKHIASFDEKQMDVIEEVKRFNENVKKISPMLHDILSLLKGKELSEVSTEEKAKDVAVPLSDQDILRFEYFWRRGEIDKAIELLKKTGYLEEEIKAVLEKYRDKIK